MVFTRSLMFTFGYFILTVSYGTLSVFTWLLPPRIRHRTISSWTRAVIVWLRISCGVRYQLIGQEHIRDISFPAMILSKHQSAWETLYLQGIFWPAATVLKQELLRIPFFGWGLRAMSPIAIDRSHPRKALKQVKEMGATRLSQGFNVILFPEGTRMPPGEKGVYARSGADIAATTNAPIIPIALNAARCWPSGSFRKYPGLITVSVGPMIHSQGKRSKEIMAEVEDWIETETKRLESHVE